MAPVFTTIKKLVLASGSPRRQEFFQQLGLEFQVCCCDIDETPLAHESPQTYVRRLALAKAETVAGKQSEASVVVGADTAVVLQDEILGKPRDEVHGLEMLQRLQGCFHEVLTGFAVVSGDRKQVEVVSSRVLFHHFSDEVLQAYVTSGDGRDKAGGYGIQSGGAFLVRQIEGSYSNVIGLPMTELVQVLLDFGAIEPDCTS
jgi:septum formation protein